MQRIRLLLPAAAVLLVGALVCLWVYSYVPRQWIVHDRRACVTYSVFRGDLWVVTEVIPPGLLAWCASREKQAMPQFLWCESERTESPAAFCNATVRLRVPIWPFTLLMLLLFAAGTWRWLPWCQRWRRKRAGLCTRCGYNVYGLTEARCPECGEPFGEARLQRGARGE